MSIYIRIFALFPIHPTVSSYLSHRLTHTLTIIPMHTSWTSLFLNQLTCTGTKILCAVVRNYFRAELVMHIVKGKKEEFLSKVTNTWKSLMNIYDFISNQITNKLWIQNQHCYALYYFKRFKYQKLIHESIITSKG